eukprot:scaffold130649_cov34-Prasinocladus_malaysianus.AAC.1
MMRAIAAGASTTTGTELVRPRTTACVQYSYEYEYAWRRGGLAAPSRTVPVPRARTVPCNKFVAQKYEYGNRTSSPS